MTEIKTTSEVAALLGCSADTVRRHARRMGLGHALTTRQTVFFAHEVDLIRPHVRDQPGNPSMADPEWQRANAKKAWETKKQSKEPQKTRGKSKRK